MKQLFFIVIAFSFSQLLSAQAEDAEGCNDHPMFNRMPNSNSTYGRIRMQQMFNRNTSPGYIKFLKVQIHVSDIF